MGPLMKVKHLNPILHPVGNIEIWIASGAPLNTALAAEVADGWLPMGYGLDGWDIHGPNLEKAFKAKRKPCLERISNYLQISAWK
ncbi:MAG: hypothetical protein CM15mP49_34970 [Actinomycetota bacterium]|nr:MAG: hypothetical protein CM15mP49_34970 [Actinomycetota bacterium]